MMEGVIKASEFMEELRRQKLVIVPQTVAESMTVRGIPIEAFQKRILTKKLLSSKEISDARLWGPIGKRAVRKIISQLVPVHDQVACDPLGTIKIPLSIVKSIASSRGYSWG